MGTTTTTKKLSSEKIINPKLGEASEMFYLAEDLAKFIKENNLFQNIQGKEFVNVEGWQYAGARLGLVPVIESVSCLNEEGELRYSAWVSIIQLENNIKVGAGFGFCSNKEQGKKYYQEFAISSMAQTRAIGKAYRNLLAWIIRAAGYEPTPAEEMDYSGNVPAAPKPSPAENEKPNRPTEPAPKPQQKQDEISLPDTTAEEEAPAPAIKYANARQKEEIIRLLNNPVITRQEKTKMLLNINKLDEERALQSIEKLKKAIEEREEGGETAK